MARISNDLIFIHPIQWNVSTADTAPTTAGMAGDIVAVPIEGAEPLPDMSGIVKLNVFGDLVTSDGNIYERNSVNLFYSTDGVAGTVRAKIFELNTFAIEGAFSAAVINVNGTQAECDVYLWDIDTNSWAKYDYVKLPPVFREEISLLDWTTKDIDKENISVWAQMGIVEENTTLINANLYDFDETVDLAAWVTPQGLPTVISVWGDMGITEAGTITINDTPTPF